MSLHQRLRIDRLGGRGEGLAQGPHGLIAVPYALPFEMIIAEVDGGRGKLVEIETASPDRIAPFCRYYGSCGGCAIQALRPDAYADWKRGLLVEALRQAGLGAVPAPLLDAHGEGRRRATFHARMSADGAANVGFMEARSHRIVDIAECPVLAPSLFEAPQIARGLGRLLAASGKPLDILLTATASGLDVDIRGHGPLSDEQARQLVGFALRHDLARLANHGAIVALNRAPLIRMGQAMVAPPPGAFLQATQAGEEALAAEVTQALSGARRVADLFAGVGTFSLRLAEFAAVHAVDSEGAALAALARAAGEARLRPVSVETRDLFRRPLSSDDLSSFDGIVFDPPRAGAPEQARAIATSRAPVVVAVSCNPQSFARDAAILSAGGYELERVLPVDQFRHSPHLEIVARFRREAKKRSRKLLG
ncbi:RNA methyltransferase [Methylocella silvestris]|uniref:RNA methyltransferase n=1 Tax=Methylocella silvestris TaxID=199596 RepID=A0A2J7TER5_METSI|nr:RNA methyltransferase [Methylocella silvestris]